MSYYVYTPLIALFINFALVFLVLRRNHKSFLHRVFSLFLLSMALWGLTIFGMRSSPDLETALKWDKAMMAIGPWMSVFFYHFTLLFTGIKSRMRLVPAAYLLCILIAALAPTDLLFAGMEAGPYGYAPVTGVLGYPSIFAIYLFIVLGLINLVSFHRATTIQEERRRTTFIIVGVGCALLGGMADIVHAVGVPIPPLGIHGNILFGGLATVAILKYNLLDIHIVLRKGVAYVLTSALIAIPFVSVFLLVTFFFEEERASPWVYFLLFIALVFILPQLWQWIQRRVERWFYRDRYDYLKALVTFSQETQSVTDSAKLGSTMVNLLTGALRTSSVYILEPLPSSGDFIIAFPSGSYRSTSHVILKRGSPLVKWLERSKEMLSYDNIDMIPQLQGITSKEKENLQQLHTKYITKLKTPTGQLSGLLILGPKLSDQPYTIEDKELIHTICNQMSTNLENARLYAASQQEVAERKRTEEALRESKELFEKTFNSQQDAIFILDAKNPPNIMACNLAAVGMFGYTSQEVLGRTTAFLHLDEAALQKFQEYLYPAIENHGFFHLPEFKMKKKDGTVFPTEHNVADLKDKGGKRIGWVSLIHDITERKRAEEELKQSHEQLRNLSAHIESMREAERTSVAREVHDELGQALTALKMDLSWLNKRLPEEQEALIRKTIEMSRLIGTTIQTVKRISTELRPGVLDDLGLLAAIEWQAQEFQERTRIKCKLTAEGEDINLDRDLATAVFRILQEALTNVARHANATRVEVSLKKGDGQLMLQVRDNGKGITKKQIAHPKSFGLIGMRERVHSWNGSVKIDGISGKGTIVTVSIPLTREEERDDENTSR